MTEQLGVAGRLVQGSGQKRTALVVGQRVVETKKGAGLVEVARRRMVLMCIKSRQLVEARQRMALPCKTSRLGV